MELFKYKIILKKNNTSDIIRLDNNYVNFKFFNYSNVIIDIKEINLYYLPSSIFQYFFSKHKLSLKYIYLRNIILSYKPIILIGYNIDIIIYKCKELCPEIITIIYQHNIIYDYMIENYRKLYSSCKSDYFLVFDNRHREIFSKFINSKYILSGSVKNNEIALKKKDKDYTIMYISEFRNYPKDHYRSIAEKNIVDILADYCKNTNNKMCIALSSLRAEKKSKLNINDELKFFDQENNNYFVEPINSYELANKSELCVNLSSNLGPELLARGFKVLFLSILELYDKNLKHPYYGADSPLFYCGLDRQIIFSKINYLLKINKIEYNKVLNNSNFDIGFDKGNTILKKIIKEHLDSNSNVAIS